MVSLTLNPQVIITKSNLGPYGITPCGPLYEFPGHIMLSVLLAIQILRILRKQLHPKTQHSSLRTFLSAATTGIESKFHSTAPLVKIHLSGIPLIALLDTGSGVTIISDNVAERLNICFYPPVTSALSLTGHTLKMRASATVTITIGKTKIRHNVLVQQGTPVDCVLGSDFLNKLGNICFNFADRRVAFNRESIPFVTTPPDLPMKVSAIKEVLVPARMQMLIAGTIPVRFSTPTTVMLEPESTLTSKTQLFMARSFEQIQGNQVTVCIMNPNPFPVWIPPGKTLAFAELATIKQPLSAATYTQPKQSILNEALINSDLPPEQKRQLEGLLKEYSDIFAKSDWDLGRTNLVHHHIDTGNFRPIYSHPYRVPHAQKPIIKQHIDEMLENNIIRPSTSPWSSPIVMVKKKSGEDRFCIDFRKLNSVTKQDKYGLPRIDEILDSLGKAKIFSSLDMASGYWQVEVDEESKEKTAFTSPFGHFEFNVLPFGLTNAPPGFQRLMDFVLSGLQWEFSLVYLDDVLVYSPTFQDHISHLQQVFDRFRKYNLKLKMRKCHFGKTEVEFLGHIVGQDGIKPNPEKITAVQNMNRPRTVRQVRQLVGLLSYYRRFIPNFSKIAAPLHKLTKKNERFYWSEECEIAANTLKERLITAPVLIYPNFEKQFILETDASNIGIGATISQVYDDGLEHPIAYASRVLQDAEKNYSTSEKEALAIVWAYQQFRPYLFNKEFIIKSDHAPLKWVFTQPKPNQRMQRWAMMLSEAKIKDFHYKPGPTNTVPDALSRNIPGRDLEDQGLDSEMPHDIQNHSVNKTVPKEIPGKQLVLSAATHPEPFPFDIAELQRKDPQLNVIIQFLEKQEVPPDKTPEQLEKQTSEYFICNEILYHQTPTTRRNSLQFPAQIVVPKDLRQQILKIHHDDVFGGHLGFEKTLSRITQRFYWPLMNKEIQDYCTSCHLCLSRKHPHQYFVEPMNPIPVSGPFDRVSVDVLGPVHVTERGNRYIIVFCDFLTKYVEAFAVPDVKTETIAPIFVEEICCRHGSPLELLSDNATYFVSNLMNEVTKLMNSKQVTCTPYHPQCNGLVEKFNKTIAHMLSMYTNANQTDWDRFLKYLLLAYHTTKHSTTGETPAFLLYGRDLRMPSDLAFQCSVAQFSVYNENYANFIRAALSETRQLAVEHITKRQEMQKIQSDKKANHLPLAEGDSVYLYIPQIKKGLSHKFFSEWGGPYTVVKLKRPNAIIERLSHPKTFPIKVHISRLKKIPPQNYLPPALHRATPEEQPLPQANLAPPIFPPERDRPTRPPDINTGNRYNLRSKGPITATVMPVRCSRHPVVTSNPPGISIIELQDFT